jgi:hypothetical protein
VDPGVVIAGGANIFEHQRALLDFLREKCGEIKFSSFLESQTFGYVQFVDDKVQYTLCLQFWPCTAVATCTMFTSVHSSLDCG